MEKELPRPSGIVPGRHLERGDVSILKVGLTTTHSHKGIS